MDEQEIYLKVLNRLYEGLKIDKYQKFKNDRTKERDFAVGNLYPDVILTKRKSKDIEFIVEIVLASYANIETLKKKWKPLSKSGASFFLLVPKSKLKLIEKWCKEEKLKVRFGTYEIKSNEVDIKFF